MTNDIVLTQLGHRKKMFDNIPKDAEMTNDIVVAYLRHGEKMYDNGKNPEGFPKHDPPLTPEGIENIKTKALEINLRVKPDLIICSPLRRTRETAEIIADTIYEQTGALPKILLDGDIGEFLGNQKPAGEVADLYRESYLKTDTRIDPQIIGNESLKDFRWRCKRHLDRIRCIKTDKPYSILVVTHSFVMNNVFHYLTGFNLRKSGEGKGFVWYSSDDTFKFI